MNRLFDKQLLHDGLKRFTLVYRVPGTVTRWYIGGSLTVLALLSITLASVLQSNSSSSATTDTDTSTTADISISPPNEPITAETDVEEYMPDSSTNLTQTDHSVSVSAGDDGASVTINGDTTELPANSSMSQSYQSNDATTSLDVSIHNNSSTSGSGSSTTSSSSVQTNVYSQSSTTTDGRRVP